MYFFFSDLSQSEPSTSRSLNFDLNILFKSEVTDLYPNVSYNHDFLW